MTFDETPPPSKTAPFVDDDLVEEEAIKVTEKKNLENDIEDETLEVDEVVKIKESRNHPLENVIGNLNQRTLMSQAQNQSNFFCFISTIKPKNVNKALTDESWMIAMQEELNQFIVNDVWEVVPQLKNMTIIGTKWVFRNKLDENGVISQNKASWFKGSSTNACTGRYAQRQLRFLRYIDTRPNGDALRKCILKYPYKLTIVIILAVPTADDSLAVPKCIAVEILLNMSPKNKAHYQSKKEAIHLPLTRIGDEIYSTIDACKIAHNMWVAIERLQHGESLNIQDVKTNLFWEFGRFTSHNGEIMESYYSRFYKMMNEMIRNNLAVATMQVNVYTKISQIICAQSKQSSSTRSHASTRYKGTEIAKPITPPSESASKEDNDPEQTQRDKDMQKNLALIAKYIKKINKPTNNNLKTFLNSRNKNVDTSPRYKNDNQTGQFRNQRTVTVVGARETVDSGTDSKPLEKVDSNVILDSSDMCENDIQTDQNAKEYDDEHVTLANLIANLILETEENKNILKQLKKANTSLTQELKECKSNLEESNTTRDSCLIALQSKQTELEMYKTLNDRIVDYDKLKLNVQQSVMGRVVTDIQEKDKNKAKNDKIEHENGKSVKQKSSQSPKSKPKSKPKERRQVNEGLRFELGLQGKIDGQDMLWYGYMKNHMKTVKNGQARTQERKSEQKPEAKARKSMIQQVPEGYDLLLWGDLKTLFEPSEEDEIWKNQQDYNLISWRLFDSCGVHVLLMDNGIAIHMMIEKKYPFTQ
ncbi:hypothetical protein Tco_0053702 [Tanacetum coccineum]